MKLRALARLAVGAVLIPIAVLIASASVFHSAATLALLPPVPWTDWLRHLGGRAFVPQDPISHYLGGSVLSPSEYRLARTTPDNRLILRGDPSRTGSGRERAIWEAHPTSIIFYANYISALARECNDLMLRGGRMPNFEEEVRRGESLEPDNGYYNHILAAQYLQWACTVSNKLGQPQRRGVIGWDDWTVTVRDRALFERGVQELAKALNKPIVDSHGNDMLVIRKRALPEPQTFAEALVLANTSSLNDLGGDARHRLSYEPDAAYAHCAAVLLSEARTNEALTLFGSAAWLQYARHPVTSRGDCIDSTPPFSRAAARSCSRLDLTKHILDRTGATNEAANMARLSDRIWRLGQESSGLPDDVRDWWRRVGSVYVFGWDLGLDVMTPSQRNGVAGLGRQLDQIVIQRIGTLRLQLFLLTIIACSLMAMGYWACHKDARRASLLLLPPARHVLVTVLCCAVLPLVAYAVYTQIPVISGSDKGTWGMWRRFATEIYLVGGLIVALTFRRAENYTRSRCLALGLPVPKISRWHSLLLVLHILFPPLVVANMFLGRRSASAFKGSLSRSMIPALALAVLAVTAVAHPFLAVREARLIAVLAQGETGLGIWMDGRNRLAQRLDKESSDLLDKWSEALPRSEAAK